MIELIYNAQPGEVVHLAHSPVVFFVEVPKPPGFTPSPDECVPEDICRAEDPDNNYIVAITKENSKHKGVHLECLTEDGDGLINLTYTAPLYDLLFACTFEKAQGKTLDKVIACLHTNMWKSPTLQHLFVWMSRVRNGTDLGIMPSKDLKLDRFLDMQHSIALLCFYNAYDADGQFSRKLYIDYYNTLLKDRKKRKAYEKEIKKLTKYMNDLR